MPNKPISAKEEVRLVKIMDDDTISVRTITKDIRKMEKAMRLQEQVRKKHAEMVDYALNEASRLTECQNTGPVLNRSGIPNATKKEATK